MKNLFQSLVSYLMCIVFPAFLISAFLILVGYLLATEHCKDDAVAAGVAHYSADANGNVVFVWNKEEE